MEPELAHYRTGTDVGLRLPVAVQCFFPVRNLG